MEPKKEDPKQDPISELKKRASEIDAFISEDLGNLVAYARRCTEVDIAGLKFAQTMLNDESSEQALKIMEGYIEKGIADKDLFTLVGATYMYAQLGVEKVDALLSTLPPLSSGEN